MDNKTFYNKVGEILKLDDLYVYDEKTLGGTFRTRWNNRSAGNGRIPNYGILRFYNEQTIHLSFYYPTLQTKVFDNPSSCFEFLKNLLT